MTRKGYNSEILSNNIYYNEVRTTLFVEILDGSWSHNFLLHLIYKFSGFFGSLNNNKYRKLNCYLIITVYSKVEEQ